MNKFGRIIEYFWRNEREFLEYYELLTASEATGAFKQPLRSNLTPVTLITYISMYILLIWYGPF